MGVATADPPRNLPASPRSAAFVKPAEHILFGLVPIIGTIGLALFLFHIQAVAVDFRFAYYPAGVRVLHGLSPYAASHHEILRARAFVYPALSAIAFVPFALLQNGTGEVLFTLLCIACVPATLRVLEVRDWRIYGITLLWLPVYSSWQTANLTMPLVLLAALAWRYRDRGMVSGLAAGVAISLKPYMWPIALWFLATRRPKAMAWTLWWIFILNVVAWGIIGYDQVHAYLHVSHEVTAALWRGGYGILAAAGHLGFGRPLGEMLLLTISAGVVGLMAYEGLVRRREYHALILVVALILAASPLVRSHYFALLMVPLAIGRPRLGPLWLLPLLMWWCPPTAASGAQVALAWVVAGACLVVPFCTPRQTAAT
jgi:hypothetical protein